MKYPFLMLFVAILLSTFVFVMLTRVALSELEIFLNKKTKN